MMDVALQIMSSPLSLIHWETLSQLHVHCSLSFSLVFSFLSASDLFPLSVSPSHLLSPLFDDWCRFISFCYPRGSRACDARGPKGQRPSQTFRTSCSLNSSWETNEDEFGAWMRFSTKGVLGFSQSVCSSVILRLLRLFLLFGFCSVLFQFTI